PSFVERVQRLLSPAAPPEPAYAASVPQSLGVTALGSALAARGALRALIWGLTLVTAVAIVMYLHLPVVGRPAGGWRRDAAHRCGRGRRGGDSAEIHRGAALRGHERAPGPGVLLRRSRRGAARPALAGAGPAGAGAHLVLLLQGAQRRHRDHRPEAAGGAPARGERAPLGQAHPRHRAADPSRQRLSPLVEDLRPRRQGHLRGPG